jgi:CRP-like cAMP-binding protein
MDTDSDLENNREIIQPSAEEMMKILSNIKFFREQEIVGDDLKIVCDNLKIERMEEDEFVFHSGELGDKFYIILDGSVKILRPIKNNKPGSIFDQTEINKNTSRRMTKIIVDDTTKTDKSDKRTSKATFLNASAHDPDMEYEVLVKISKGASFGELALNDNKPRAATIRCAETTTFAVLNSVGYDKVFRKIMKKKQSERITFLKSIPYFNKLTNMALSKFGYEHEIVKFKRNQTVYMEGNKCEYVYIVIDGIFELSKSK